MNSSFDLSSDQQRKAQELATDMMIHDVRNPLSSIVSIVDMLHERNVSDDDRLWLTRIKTLSYRALNVLKAASGYADMERGEYEPVRVNFDLIPVMRAVLSKVSVLSESKSITVRILIDEDEADEQTVFVTGDRFFLAQMLDNLLTNALEASPSEENVTIKVETQETLRISIYNKGAIPEEKRPEIFDKLASYQQERGSGLGVYVAKLITEQHGGTISFTTSADEGTIFRVELPILTSDKA